jgi:hypothetical protein
MCGSRIISGYADLHQYVQSVAQARHTAKLSIVGIQLDEKANTIKSGREESFLETWKA